MLTFFGADQVPLALPSQGQATCSEAVTAPSPDCVADLWPQLDRMLLTSCRRTPPPNLHFPTYQHVDSQGSLDADSDSGDFFGHLRQELPDINRPQYPTEPLVRMSTALEDVISDNPPHCQIEPPAQQLCICNRSPDQSRRGSASALQARPGQTPLSQLTKHHRAELSRLLSDLDPNDDINPWPHRNAREYPEKQNPVLKRIRLRRVSKKNTSRGRKSMIG